MRRLQLWAAIDLADGKVVRVKRGDLKEATVYSDDPVQTARRWAAAGADGIHLVDLRGAIAGEFTAAETLRRVAHAVEIPVQAGGGIRSREAADAALLAGASRVVIGTAALAGGLGSWLAWGAGDLLIAADVRDEKIAIRGWTDTAPIAPREFLGELAEAGVGEALLTDISRDGMLSGVDPERYRRWAGGLAVSILASGGVASSDDLRKLAALDEVGGVVLGKSLYEGTVDLAEIKREMGG